MSEKIQITTDNARVLTFQGLENEYCEGIPEAWAACFDTESEENPGVPAFNRILYLRNVNIQPDVMGGMMRFLPVWHAAVITFQDEAPVTVLLISESALMDKLVMEYHPDEILRRLYPGAGPNKVRADMIDAGEEGIDNGAIRQFPSIVYEGWPAEEWRADYLRLKEFAEQMSEAAGKKSQIGFTYRLSIEEVLMQLHFVYLIIDTFNNEFLWIQRDEIYPLPEIDPGD